ncbi:hypothetical protein PoB_001839200 [Plakobranchus ocellatus]|uniref:Uncharacterized protein n=1 Tax=Plakobranchus ocellatus TaxID=259542 RepID=A0AAV3ZBM9_9GAST|nr:hypothetical protein PoB_001839200 [Plakobranchus ocellatus]
MLGENGTVGDNMIGMRDKCTNIAHAKTLHMNGLIAAERSLRIISLPFMFGDGEITMDNLTLKGGGEMSGISLSHEFKTMIAFPDSSNSSSAPQRAIPISTVWNVQIDSFLRLRDVGKSGFERLHTASPETGSSNNNWLVTRKVYFYVIIQSCNGFLPL